MNRATTIRAETDPSEFFRLNFSDCAKGEKIVLFQIGLNIILFQIEKCWATLSKEGKKEGWEQTKR